MKCFVEVNRPAIGMPTITATQWARMSPISKSRRRCFPTKTRICGFYYLIYFTLDASRGLASGFSSG